MSFAHTSESKPTWLKSTKYFTVWNKQLQETL